MARSLREQFGRFILSYSLSQALSTCEASERINDDFSAIHGSELASLEQLFLRHLLQLRCNSHAVSEVLGERGGESASVEMVSEARIGTVLLQTASLINHSCAPSAIFRFKTRARSLGWCLKFFFLCAGLMAAQSKFVQQNC